MINKNKPLEPGYRYLGIHPDFYKHPPLQTPIRRMQNSLGLVSVMGKIEQPTHPYTGFTTEVLEPPSYGPVIRAAE
jgi:hypothetical protein